MEGSATVTTDPAGDTLNLLYSQEEDDLRAAVRALLEDRCGWPAVLERTESGEPYDTALWRGLAADIGCAGLLVPATSGGAGASYRETALTAEELGRFVAPVPYLGSAVVATTALLAVGDRELLPRLADGACAALAVPFATPPGGPAPGGLAPLAVRVNGPHTQDRAAGVTRLSGDVPGLADALPADIFVVPADGVPYGLYAVEASADGVKCSAAVSLDMTRQLCDLSLHDAPARMIASGDIARFAVSEALKAGAAMLASEQLGLAEQCLTMTVAYVKERRQFARPVGSFQALKHRLADLWVSITQARAAARYAAGCLATGAPDAPVAVALAKSACCEAAVRAAEECVQMHGGIGFTWEHPAHLYLKRAKSGAIAFGTPDMHRAALARLANLPPAR
jgi:alkylation response protein AidB-like acyl-CoA dehydrogenase